MLGKLGEITYDSKDYAKRTNKYTKNLGTDFSNFNPMQSYNISMDRCFTSVTIANWALVKGFPDVDTMKQYWKVIPKKLKSMNSLKTKFCYGCVLQQKISRCFLTLIRKNLVEKTSLF